ncbi:hypothetical protein NC651_039214 [Populus alba x Populus x berolinensis]|nr:hypothetical protein NC651_039214 [Populus alba x Populus x berolinensis]
MLEDNISSRNGNLIVPDLGAEVMSDVTSSSGPMKLEDLQRILSNIGSSGDPDEGSLNSRGYFRLVAESSFPLASGFFYLCKKCEADPSCSVSCPFDDSQFYKVLRTGQIDLSQSEINPNKCKWSVAPEPVA